MNLFQKDRKMVVMLAPDDVRHGAGDRLAKNLLEALPRTPAAEVRLDLRQLDDMPLACLGILAGYARRVMAVGGNMRVLSSESLTETLAAIGFQMSPGDAEDN